MKLIHRRTVVKDILWIVATVGLVAAVVRFGRGLGATTALNDATPWGLWIGFDVMAGVALAAGGFTIAAVVYIFQLERYRPILRPAILTAFLGYGAVIVGLICDLGLPWHIWKPVVHWQHHSVLFEVAWCVMLYTTVLTLEFAPAVLEHPLFQSAAFRRVYYWLKRLTLVWVIAGIVLSTLHQSSLGSLLLIMPFRLHPLWYSPLLPVLFFVSAVALGLMMVTLEGFFSAYLYGHRLRVDLYTGLGRAAGWVLWVYLALRLGDLAWRGVLPAALDGSWYSYLFLVEIGAGALLPAILLAVPSIRTSPAGLATGAGLVVAGMVLNRLSASIIAMFQTPGVSYFPAWTEFAVSAGIVAGAGLVFLFAAENFNVFGPEKGHAPEKASPYARPVFNPETRVYAGNTLWDTLARRSAVLLVAVALAVALLPPGAVAGQNPLREPVQAALGWSTMLVDGNRNRQAVAFDHLGHQARLQEAAAGNEETCLACHHLSNPNDEVTACSECHRDMNRPTSIFVHTQHQQVLGGNASCVECHSGEHTARTAKTCGACHDTMKPKAGESTFNDFAPAYREAMHAACIPCHQQEAELQNKPELGRCPACHARVEEKFIAVK